MAHFNKPACQLAPDNQREETTGETGAELVDVLSSARVWLSGFLRFVSLQNPGHIIAGTFQEENISLFHFHLNAKN